MIDEIILYCSFLLIIGMAARLVWLCGVGTVRLVRQICQ